MRIAVLFDHGPNWQPDRSVYEQGRPMQDHLDAMARLYDEGTLLLGGPFATKGGLAILDAPDLTTATALMDRDPAVAAGVLTHRTVGMTAHFDAFTGHRAGGTVGELSRS